MGKSWSWEARYIYKSWVVIRSNVLAKTLTLNLLDLRMSSNPILPRFLQPGPAKKSKEAETSTITCCASQYNWLSAGPLCQVHGDVTRRSWSKCRSEARLEVKMSSESFGASFGADIIEDNTRPHNLMASPMRQGPSK